MAKVLAI